MDHLPALVYGCAAFILLSAACILWRRGASCLSRGAVLFSNSAGRSWADGFRATLLMQSAVPASLVSLGMRCLGLSGAPFYGLGSAAGLLLPLTAFLPLWASAAAGLAGLFLLFAPVRSAAKIRDPGLLLLSVSLIGLFGHFSDLAAGAVFAFDAPSSQTAVSLLLLFLGICLCYLFESEAFALIVPIGVLSSGLIPVNAYLFYACGTHIGSFLRILVLAWDYRTDLGRDLELVFAHRALGAFLCILGIFVSDVPFFRGSLLFAVLWPCAAFAFASLPFLPASAKARRAAGGRDGTGSLCHPLFVHLPSVAVYALRIDAARRFTLCRDLFCLSMEAVIRPDGTDSQRLEEIEKQTALLEEKSSALLHALEKTATRGDAALLGALSGADSSLRLLHASVCDLAPYREDPVPSSASDFLDRIEDRTLRDMDAAIVLLTEASRSPQEPRTLPGEDESPGPDPSDPSVSGIAAVCRGISRCALACGDSFAGSDDPSL